MGTWRQTSFSPLEGRRRPAGRMRGMSRLIRLDRQAALKRAISSARAGSVSVTAAPNSSGVSEASSG